MKKVCLVCVLFVCMQNEMTAQNRRTPKVLLNETFGYPNGLITNEYAYWNPNDLSAKHSTMWEMTSGSLFARDGAGWSGIPDSENPDRLSINANNSAVFRLTTKRTDFGDVAVSFNLWNEQLVSSPKVPPADWDGVHIFLRYQTEYSLYYASINRRDNKVVIKKKVPGGPSNDGTYFDLSVYENYVVPYKQWQNVRATVRNNMDHSVTIELFCDDKLLIRARDDGSIGGAPINVLGKVGIRGDNSEFYFKNFKVLTTDGFLVIPAAR